MPSWQRWDCCNLSNLVAFASPGVLLPCRRGLHMESIRKTNENWLASLEPKQGDLTLRSEARQEREIGVRPEKHAFT